MDRAAVLGRYHQLVRQTMPTSYHPMEGLLRRAYQHLHPHLPDSSRKWTVEHAARAAGEIKKHGSALWFRTMEVMRERYPATLDQVERLKALAAEVQPDGMRSDQVYAVIGSRVAPWIELEAAKLRLEHELMKVSDD